MKATSLFGGVQVFQILISIIRSKFVAILIGPKGMGILELLRSTVEIISRLTNMGLGISAIKNIASANSTGDQKKISTTVTVFRKIVWVTGLLGSVITFFLAPWLSKFAFGSNSFTIAFQWLSLTLLMNQLFSGQIVVLQGLRRLQYLAKANLTGSFIGLIITVPMYYIWGIDAIVPVLITSSAVSLISSFYYARKIPIESVSVTKNEIYKEGKSMISMGVVLSLSGVLTIIEAYLVRIYISSVGDVIDVGLFSAGFAIIGTYTGMILNSMATDYYPRLSEVIDDNTNMKDTVNKQAEIAVLLLAPLLTIFLIFIDWGIILLYSYKFLPISEMIHWAALGIFFKSGSWSMGFIFLAKGDKKWFFWGSLIKVVYFFILNILGYKYMGLTGLGISFFLAYLLGFIQNLLITNFLYKFSFTKDYFRIFFILFLIAISGFFIYINFESHVMYFLGSLLIISSSVFSYYELNKRLDIQGILMQLKSKLKKY
ncbi:oligosaccharide flippase family protein [Lutimonas saemankumensis]|uniref:oligosaccharide flippase family protein n=1 Tax=Lutimonas saemankumensis TaxID=483016 RepID=UPI001CD3C2A0|nr:oligosaccharide flippase family protein [Lutimonas saemankumensis]MCA0932655.1 oligosaccharide flippase family protein [Lutimonas saemankumensis]